MKKMIAVVIVATLLIISVFYAQQSRKTDQWIHRTFQGTVSEMWDSGEIVIFTLISHVNGNEYNFEAYKEAISSINFVVGAEVVVECDYNIREHNGKDIPYPAALIADATIHDKE